MIPQEDRSTFLRDLGPFASQADRCIRCGFCNAVCPTSNVRSAYKESRTSRGRLVLVQSVSSGIGGVSPYSTNFHELIDLCFACRRCVEVCPAGIAIPDLMVQTRFAYLNRKGLKALNPGQLIFANYDTFDRLGSLFAPISNWLMRNRVLRKALESFAHIDARSQIPPFERSTFHRWFRNRRGLRSERKIVYFVDAYANYNRPDIGMTVVHLLEELGYEVIVPPQRASGMPAIEYGMLDKAKRIADYNVKQLASRLVNDIPVVCSSPAASFLLKYGYPELLSNRDSRIVAERTWDIHEFLREQVELRLCSITSELDSRSLLYHYCCLAKALKTGPIIVSLLKECGYEVSMTDRCCGGAGVWSMFEKNYDIGREIGAPLCRSLAQQKEVVTESETCKLQIESNSGTQVHFPIEIVAPHVQFS